MRAPLWRLVALALLLPQAVGVQAASDAPFLWRVDAARTTHYLMGSVHLLPETVYPLPPALEQAYAQTRALVLETDPDALAAPQTQMRMLQEGLAREGLRREIAPDLYARVRRHAQARELPAEFCDRFRAWFCALSLGMHEFMRAGMDPASGLDQHFFQRARRDGRTLRWLEAPEAQLDLFAHMSPRMAERFLHSALEDLARPELQPEALVRLWRDNDGATLARMIDAGASEFPDTHARLLADRNRAWMAELERLLRGDTPQLVVVGAAHLVGRDNVLALLRARGIEARAVATR
jgi:uncharacterized protein